MVLTEKYYRVLSNAIEILELRLNYDVGVTDLRYMSKLFKCLNYKGITIYGSRTVFDGSIVLRTKSDK
ncbi:unnamed protein product [Rhizophagus irregularis]|nr:unnamed protein product [Rhizophagus irregularis]